MSADEREFRIALSFDTETTNLKVGEDAADVVAFPVLFIALDLRDVDIRSYRQGDGALSFMRTEGEMLALVDSLVSWGEDEGCVPVVCAYNMMFDLTPLMGSLSASYEMEVAAQNTTHAYYIDLMSDGRTALRFWDTFYLEMRGLAAMGETCGLPKAEGDWDYTLVRAPDTPLTDEELFYAGRDVEVIPAYLRYLLDSNPWMEPGMLGRTVLTKTSLVRQTAKHETGRLRLEREGRRPISVQAMFERLCSRELARDYGTYALRKACFRGGLTFTSARYSGVVQRNVWSLDETSAHHAYINGHMVPVRFERMEPRYLTKMAENVCERSTPNVLEFYENPWGVAFHARVRYRNIRLREGSAFERLRIGILAEGKFKVAAQVAGFSPVPDEAGEAGEEAVKRNMRDLAWGATFAFGKLMSADVAEVHLSEIECWLVSRVYSYDSMEVLEGEGTFHFVKPPDYVALLSNLLFERKQAMKRITKVYREGEPYPEEIPASIPEGIAARLRDGSMAMSDVTGYYQSTVKGQFNSIYGTQAQDVFKPEYGIEGGLIEVDPDSIVSPENFAAKREKVERKPVLYTYGLRIVGGSRMPIIIGIELLDAAFGERVRVLGGDTDSMKISCDPGVDGADLVAALEPLHAAVRRSISVCMDRLRRNFPDYASDLAGVGEFEVEGEPYELHMEAWNKARVSYDGQRAHITCAGLSRPKGAYTIEDYIDELMEAGWSFEDLAPNVLGWGVTVSNSICHHLEHKRPKPTDVADLDVTDWRGDVRHVHAHQSIALYPSDRVLGDILMPTNMRCVTYMESMGRRIDTRPRWLERAGGRAALYISDGTGFEEARP